VSKVLNIKSVTVKDSSFIAKIAYETKAFRLTVMFTDGAIHQYAGVPASVATEFAAAPSKGRYFHTNIRDVYESQKAS
jgi:hypothetical protein